MFQLLDVSPSGCFIFGYFTFWMFHLLDVSPSGCFTFGMFHLWDVSPLGCFTFGMFHLRMFHLRMFHLHPGPGLYYYCRGWSVQCKTMSKSSWPSLFLFTDLQNYVVPTLLYLRIRLHLAHLITMLSTKTQVPILSIHLMYPSENYALPNY